MLDLSQQYGVLAGPIQREIDEMLRSQQFILGSKVEEFERVLSGYTGARFTIGVSSGTDALLALFMGRWNRQRTRRNHHCLQLFRDRR